MFSVSSYKSNITQTLIVLSNAWFMLLLGCLATNQDQGNNVCWCQQLKQMELVGLGYMYFCSSFIVENCPNIISGSNRCVTFLPINLWLSCYIDVKSAQIQNKTVISYTCKLLYDNFGMWCRANQVYWCCRFSGYIFEYSLYCSHISVFISLPHWLF